MNIVVLGSGGREHALTRALNRDACVERVWAIPGNPGIPDSISVDMMDFDAVIAAATRVNADLIVVGPEAPLVAGVADRLREAGFAVFGPSAQAAVLEGSKAFAKDVMNAAGVPTAASYVCESAEAAAAALDAFGPPYVVKNDGLAAGKGVVVTNDRAEALSHAEDCGRVVIEEFLDGPEVSLFVVTDGDVGVPLQPAQDFKRVGDNNEGPNTGGMGAYSPLDWAPVGLVDQVMDAVVAPTLAQMRTRGTPFAGLLYVGLALTSRGPKVVEFNARFGDPETQVVLPLLESGLGGLLFAAATGQLAAHPPLEWSEDAAVIVVLAAKGYPGTPKTGGRIELPADTASAHVIQAGTSIKDGALVASGGRVLGVVGRGDTLESAREAAYDHVARVTFPDGFHRSDIAK